MGKSLQDLGLKDEPLPAANLDEAPVFGSFAPPPEPGAYRFKLPTDLSGVWDTIDSSKGQRINMILDGDAPLLITQSANGRHVGEPFQTRLSNVERKRGKDAGEFSDLDYLLKAFGIKTRPAGNRAMIEAIRPHKGGEFGADVVYNWSCSEKRDKRVKVTAPDGTVSTQVQEGQKGCGARYYQNDIPKNPDGSVPLEIQCGQCGASLRAFAQLENFRK